VEHHLSQNCGIKKKKSTRKMSPNTHTQFNVKIKINFIIPKESSVHDYM